MTPQRMEVACNLWYWKRMASLRKLTREQWAEFYREHRRQRSRIAALRLSLSSRSDAFRRLEQAAHARRRALRFLREKNLSGKEAAVRNAAAELWEAKHVRVRSLVEFLGL